LQFAWTCVEGKSLSSLAQWVKPLLIGHSDGLMALAWMGSYPGSVGGFFLTQLG